MNDHFSPVGKPAPPRPRRPEAFISLMIQSRPFSRIALVPSQWPRAIAPLSERSKWPYILVKMRSLSCSIFLSSARLLAEDALIFGDTALGQRLGLLHPVLALDPSLKAQIGIHPFPLDLGPGCDLGVGVDAEIVEDALDPRAHAGDHLQVVRPFRALYPLRPCLVASRRGSGSLPLR